MSTRYNDGSHYENHQRAAELHDVAAHAHRVGEQHGEQEHLTGQEQTRLASEHSQNPHRHDLGSVGGSSSVTFGHKEIAAHAYELWQARGCPHGSPEADWFQAAKELRGRGESELRRVTEVEPSK